MFFELFFAVNEFKKKKTKKSRYLWYVQYTCKYARDFLFNPIFIVTAYNNNTEDENIACVLHYNETIQLHL